MRYVLNSRTGRPIYGVADTDPIPPGGVEVSQEVWNHAVAGDPRYYKDANNLAMRVDSSTVWLPGYTPGAGWTEITKAEYDALTSTEGV